MNILKYQKEIIIETLKSVGFIKNNSLISNYIIRYKIKQENHDNWYINFQKKIKINSKFFDEEYMDIFIGFLSTTTNFDIRISIISYLDWSITFDEFSSIFKSEIRSIKLSKILNKL